MRRMCLPLLQVVNLRSVCWENAPGKPSGTLKTVIRVGRLRHALRAGLNAQLITTFIMLLAVAPWLAAQNEFPGHEHPPGTPDHVHPIEQVIGWTILSTVFVAVLSSLPFEGRIYEMPESWTERVRLQLGNTCRAPPVRLF